MLVLHRAKLFASNQSVLALGVAPSGVRAAAPHSAPARMPGVYAQRLCTTQSQQSIHSPSPRGRGLRISYISKKTDFFYNLFCCKNNRHSYRFYVTIQSQVKTL